MSEIKFLGDGTAVLVVGEAPARSTSTDGGRTSTEVAETYVARLELETVDNDQLLDERPEIDPATGYAVAPDAVPAEAEPEVVPLRGDAQNADELQAEIDRLTAARDAAVAAQHGAGPPETH